MQKEIEDKDKEILIYLETIEQGKKERLELKNQLKKLKEEKEDWEKEKEALEKRIHKMKNAGFLPYCCYYWLMMRSINARNLKFTDLKGRGRQLNY